MNIIALIMNTMLYMTHYTIPFVKYHIVDKIQNVQIFVGLMDGKTKPRNKNIIGCGLSKHFQYVWIDIQDNYWPHETIK